MMILTESLGVNECVTNDVETSFSRNKQGKRKFQNVCMYLYLIITVRNEVSAPGGSASGGGVCCCGGALLLGVCFGGAEADPPGERATAAHGTHPTGMDSCLEIILMNSNISHAPMVDQGFPMGDGPTLYFKELK